MNRVFGIFIASILILGSLGLSQSAFAANYNEIEQNGQTLNNILANAETIAPALFTTPEPADVFARQGQLTATILGNAGSEVIIEGSSATLLLLDEKVNAQGHTEDLDWYSFTISGIGNKIFMADVDDAYSDFDSQLHLFDANGFPVAFNDDSCPEDPGTVFCQDSFIGEITLSPGTYYIAINSWAEVSAVNVFDCESISALTRPDNGNGGFKCEGPPGAADTSMTSGAGGDSNYFLHLSLLMPSVGGTFEGVNTTSLLVSGAQMNAAWMIPVIVSGIGFAIVIARKF